jgi:ABC-type taurine transport system substrate-binding protein
MKNTVSLTNETAAQVSKLAKLYGMSDDECVERLLTRFVFDTIDNEVLAEEAEQIICRNLSQAEALAKRSFRVSAVQYGDGWGVKAVRV